MPRYALVDGDGVTQNIILLDDPDTYTPPAGLTVVPEVDAAPYAPAAEPTAEISALDFFNRFTDGERVAVMAACAASPELHVGLVNGLASGSVTLDGDKLGAWMAALVQVGAITEERRVEIQTA